MNIEEIEAIRTQTIVHIQDLLAASGPTITVNGTETPWAPLLAPLRATLDWCDHKLAEYQPFEVRSAGSD
ncbi:MAG: hypothetical protein IT424_11645 [Pirellulales bacterium]|nr:hypothetical protein [Pirellulales bacterium]